MNSFIKRRVLFGLDRRGGGKGAAIGAGSGAGAGAITQILTKGTIKVPVESILTFKLDEPLRVNTRS
jgi:hypothetical protein